MLPYQQNCKCKERKNTVQPFQNLLVLGGFIASTKDSQAGMLLTGYLSDNDYCINNAKQKDLKATKAATQNVR